MGGIAIAVLGIWVLVQVLAGDALGRLNLTAGGQRGESFDPGTEWGDVL